MGDADEGQPGRRQRAAVLARRQVAGLPGPEEGRATRPTGGTSLVVDCWTGRDVRRRSRRTSPQSKDVSVERVRLAGRTATTLLFTADEKGTTPIFDIARGRRARSRTLARVAAGSHGSLSVSRGRQAARVPAGGDESSGRGVRRHGDGRRAETIRRVSHANDKLLAELDLPRPESVDGPGRRRHADADVDPQAARLRPEEEMAARLPRPRRAAGGVGGRLELPLEPAAVGGPGLRRRPAQPARLDRLRPEVRRRDHRRLGRQVLRRPDGRARLPGEAAVRRQGPHRPRPGRRSAAT